MEGAGFALVVECGLRGSVDTFDQLSLHTFPDGTRTPGQIWAEDVTPIAKAKPALLDAFRTQAPCGILAETLAHKALSSSFVGAFAGALVIAEPKSCAADTVVSAARSSTDNCEATPPYVWHFGRRIINVVSESPASRPCCDECPLRGRLGKLNDRSLKRSRHRLCRRRSPVVASAYAK